MTVFVLGNAEALSLEDPTFEIPPLEWREGLKPGDLAELMLLSERLEPESAWVEVKDILGPGIYLGMTERGEPVEFDARSVMDIEMPELDRPPYAIGGVFDFFTKKKKEPEYDAFSVLPSEEKKRGFLDVLLRRKAPEIIGPVPEWERARRAKERREAAPPPAEPVIVVPPAGPPPEPEPPRPTIIIPPAPVPAEPVVHGEPIPIRELIVPATPTGLALPEDVFTILGPPPAAAAPPAPRAMIVPVAPAGPIVARVEEDVFTVLGPPTEIIAAPERMPALEIPSPMELTPFSMLPPEEEKGVIVRPPTEPMSLFNVLETEPERAMAPYVPVEERELSPFEVMIQPEFPEMEVTWGGVRARPGEAPPPPPAPEKPKRKGKPKVEPGAWRHRTPEEWAEFLQRKYDLEGNVFPYVQENRDDPSYQEMQLDEEDTGLPATIPIETVQAGEWSYLAEALEIPLEVLQPYLKAMDEEAEEKGYYDEGWEKFQEEFLGPISEGIEAAFDMLKPKTLPGHFFLGEDGQTQGQTYGIVYWENLPDAERKRLNREREYQREQERKKQQRQKEEAKEKEKARKQELRGIWGRMPTAEELVPWIESMYDEAFWRRVQKERKSPGFRAEMEEQKEYGEPAEMELEKIAEDGPKLYDQISAYFGIPPDVFNVYLRADDADDVWTEILYPYFGNVTEAFERVKPRGIPGRFEIGWDEPEDELFLKYLEGEEEE